MGDRDRPSEHRQRATSAFPDADLTGSIGRWIATMRVDDAIAARRREHWLEQAASEETTLVSVLADLAERQRPLALHMSTGGRHVVSITALGTDFVAARASAGTELLIRTDAITAVRSQPREPIAHSGTAVHLERSLVAALSDLAPERLDVRVTVGGGEVVSGELRSVGLDVATLRLDGDSRAHVYIPVANLVSLSVVTR